MLICNHVVAGGAIGWVLRKHPVLAFGAGVISHLALDAVPHWGLAKNAPDREERFLRVAKVDGCVGCVLMAGIVVSTGAKLGVLAGLAGATLPDIDKPARHFFGVDPSPKWFKRIHVAVQNEREELMRREIAINVAASVGWILFTWWLRRGRAKA